MPLTENKRSNRTTGQGSGSGPGRERGPGAEPRAEPAQRPCSCPICLMPFEDPAITGCGHIFCYRCLSEVVGRSWTYPRCPLCRRYI